MIPAWDDPIDDTMQDRIEEKVRDLILLDPDLLPLQVVVVGEPGAMPTDKHPFAVVFMEREMDANEDGYGASTSVRNYRYSGYVSVDVIHKDAVGMEVTERRLDVPSYKLAKKYIRAARRQLMKWGGPFGGLEQDPVISHDGRERTVEFVATGILNGLASRDENNYTNRSSFEFHIMTTRHFF